jgi:PKD repeat protein
MKKKISLIIVLAFTGTIVNAQVRFSPPPTADFAASPTTICSGEKVNYTDLSSGATSWQWHFPGGTPSTDTVKNPIVYYSTPGVYGAILTAINIHGTDMMVKSSYITINVLPPSPVITQNGYLLISTPSDNYLWSTGETTQSITATSNGIFIVTITNASGCSATSNADTLFNVGIEESPIAASMSIFPNPISSQATIRATSYLINTTLTVYNSFGQEVKQIKNISGETISFSRENLPCGLFFLRLTQDNKTIASDKIVISD